MADITLTTADRVEVVKSYEQLTLQASEAITAGSPIRIIPSSTGAGQWALSDADHATTALRVCHAIATRTVLAGESLTGIKRGIIDGLAISGLNYTAKLYVSDTAGSLADAAGTTSVAVGQVVPGLAVPPTTTSPDRLFYVDIAY